MSQSLPQHKTLRSSRLLPPTLRRNPQQHPSRQPRHRQQQKPPKGFVLEDGTPVRLKTGRSISSADAHVGDTLDFEVMEDVRVAGLLVIPKGGIAFATVTEAQSKRRMARGGKLNVNIDSVRLVTHDKAPLRAIKEVKGGGHAGLMTGGIVATSIVFFLLLRFSCSCTAKTSQFLRAPKLPLT